MDLRTIIDEIASQADDFRFESGAEPLDEAF
jgi:hypothetical protein